MGCFKEAFVKLFFLNKWFNSGLTVVIISYSYIKHIIWTKTNSRRVAGRFFSIDTSDDSF